MKNAIIIHGMPSREEYYDPAVSAGSNYHWLPWLQKQLIVRDIKADTPEMPHAYLPVYEVWKREFERFDITPETILVGHSCGGGFLIRWLSEHPEIVVAKVVLVAPYLDPDNYIGNDFFAFTIDPQLPDRSPVVIFESTNDIDSVQKTIVRLRQEIPDATYVTFQDHGHFCIGDIGEDFTALLEEVLK